MDEISKMFNFDDYDEMCVSELGLNMWTGRSKRLASGKLAERSESHAIGVG